ncbi:MAG TPA: type II secretion system protein [Sedimentisphaerales bacterium]|nr:type II secretion system protein [Sedimentisphaerales bacterium]
MSAMKLTATKSDLLGFTLIELLVVIAVIALLMGILMPALTKARKMGQAAVCLAHLRQWGTVFFMYTMDNNDKFWTEHNVWQTGVPQGGWMPYLSRLYGDVDKFRLCPSADKLNGLYGGIGTTFAQWGPGPIMEQHQFGRDATKNYGSYGTNLWINSVDPPSTMGWRNLPERQWKTTQNRNTAEIPMVSDCVWFGTNPISPGDSSRANSGDPAPAEDWWERKDPINPGDWNWDMARVTINRHSRGINMTFMDGSTRKVILTELWNFKWHRAYVQPVQPVEIPWLN